MVAVGAVAVADSEVVLVRFFGEVWGHDVGVLVEFLGVWDEAFFGAV